MRTKKHLFVFFAVLLLMPFTFIDVYAAVKIDRLAGKDRYETAVEISNSGWIDDSSRNAVLVTGENYPDALCAAPLAKKLNAPILLTGKSTLDGRTSDELKRLGVENVYIIGGMGVIDEYVDGQLKRMNIKSTRIYGLDRYGTSAAIAKYMTDEFNKVDEVVAVTGEDFADALSTAPVAAQKGMPIVLVSKHSMDNEIKSFIDGNKIARAYIVGGEDVIEDSVADLLPNQERILGRDKYERNTAVLNRFENYVDSSAVYIATGDNYPDALSGAALAAMTSSPIILTGKIPESATRDYFESRVSSITRVRPLGGGSAVPESTIEELFEGVKESEYGGIDWDYYGVYNTIYDGLESLDDAIDISEYSKSNDDVLEILEAVLNDHPEFFYLGSKPYRYSANGKLYPGYLYEKDKIKAMRGTLNEKVDDVIDAVIHPRMTDIEKERTIHDYIVKNTVYDYENSQNNTIPEESYNPYGTLILNKAVCDGYAKAMKLLLNRVGIESIVVRSYSMNHGWNLVRIEGSWYHVDSTWDDPYPDSGQIRHKYFNLDDTQIGVDHDWDRFLYPKADTVAEEFNKR